MVERDAVLILACLVKLSFPEEKWHGYILEVVLVDYYYYLDVDGIDFYCSDQNNIAVEKRD